MNDKKVTILMSTYNGEKYIEEQLESIFKQTYKNINIIIRDDGSTDNTVDILKKYEMLKKIKLEIGSNLGYTKSFYQLLYNADYADYYSFADQDDIWLNDKVENAVNALNKMDDNKANLYFSDFDYYDKNMNFISHKKSLKIELSFINSFVKFPNAGFTCVINNGLRKLYLLMPPESLFPQDYLSLLISISFGNTFYDKRICAKYRRHDKNVSITDLDFIKLQIWRLKNILLKNNINYKKMWQFYYDIYKNIIDSDKLKKLEWLINKDNRLDYIIKKVFYKYRYRENLIDEILLRILFLTCKL